MKIIHLLSGVQSFKITDQTIHVTTGTGSVFTYQSTGTAGQTAKVEGSIDGEVWSTIVEFTIDNNNQVLSAVAQHTWPYLRVTGTALVKIARGAA